MFSLKKVNCKQQLLVCSSEVCSGDPGLIVIGLNIIELSVQDQSDNAFSLSSGNIHSIKYSSCSSKISKESLEMFTFLGLPFLCLLTFL